MVKTEIIKGYTGKLTPHALTKKYEKFIKSKPYIKIISVINVADEIIVLTYEE